MSILPQELVSYILDLRGGEYKKCRKLELCRTRFILAAHLHHLQQLACIYYTIDFEGPAYLTGVGGYQSLNMMLNNIKVLEEAFGSRVINVYFDLYIKLAGV